MCACSIRSGFLGRALTDNETPTGTRTCVLWMSAGGDTKNVHGLKKLQGRRATRSRGTDATHTLSLLTQRMFLPDNNKIWRRGKKMWGPRWKFRTSQTNGRGKPETHLAGNLVFGLACSFMARREKISAEPTMCFADRFC
jgi:hypothetical protein